MQLSIANMLVLFITVHFTYHILIIIFSKRQRQAMQQTNDKLEELRCKPLKTIKEQKEFINLRHPKKIGTFKWSWSVVPKILLTITIYVFLFNVYRYVFSYFAINLALWQAILYVILFPLVLNFVLEKFKVQKGDISVFFRKYKRKE